MPVPEARAQRIDERIDVLRVPEHRAAGRDVEEAAGRVVARVESEEGVPAGGDLGGLADVALGSLTGMDGGEPRRPVLLPRLRLLGVRVRPGGRRKLREAEVPHEDEEPDDRLPGALSLVGEALVRDVVRMGRAGFARVLAPLFHVSLVPVVVPLVEDAVGDLLRALGRDPGDLLDRLPDAERCDLVPLPLRVRAREGVLDRVHHLVEAEAAPARAGAAVHDDLPEEAVEEVVAADDGARRERAGGGRAGERLREAVRERSHVVEALAGVAELAPEEGIGSVGLGLRPAEERVFVRRVAAVAWRLVAPSEAPRSVEGTVVYQVAEDVGTRGLASVAFHERPVGRRLDDVVPLAVEGEGRRRQDRRRRDREKGTKRRNLAQRRSHGTRAFPSFTIAPHRSFGHAASRDGRVPTRASRPTPGTPLRVRIGGGAGRSGPAPQPEAVESAVAVVEFEPPRPRRAPGDGSAQPVEPSALDRTAREVDARVTGGQLPGAGSAVPERERRRGADRPESARGVTVGTSLSRDRPRRHDVETVELRVPLLGSGDARPRDFARERDQTFGRGQLGAVRRRVVGREGAGVDEVRGLVDLRNALRPEPPILRLAVDRRSAEVEEP